MSAHALTKATPRKRQVVGRVLHGLLRPDAASAKAAAAAAAPHQQGVLSRVWARSSELTVKKARGAYVWDVDGNRYLDCVAGIAVVNTGHCHPKVVQAVRKQAGELMHGQINAFHNERLYELTNKLGGVLPTGVNHIYYDNTGTSGIEAAVKMVRQATQRPHIVTLFGGMHGRSALASAMTTNHCIRNPVHYPLPAGVYVAPFPSAFRWRVSEEEATARALAGLRDLLKGQVRPEQVAAVLFEPILGEGGFVAAPQAYYEGVREICNRHGILLVMDEVQSGYGRSGKMWGHEHVATAATRPDVIVSSKGVASGMPLSFVAATEEVMDTFVPGSHGGTFNGNCVSVAAAIATLEVFEEEGLVANSAERGLLLKQMLTDVFAQHMPRADVRGKGLMVGLECVDDEGQAWPEAAAYIKRHCFVHGKMLLLAPTGFDGNIVRVMPPLILTTDQVITVSQTIENALSDWRKGVKLP